MPEKEAAKGAAEAQKVELGLLDQIVDQGRLGRDAAGKARGKDMIKQFISVLQSLILLEASGKRYSRRIRYYLSQ